MAAAAGSISDAKTHSPPAALRAAWNPPIPAKRSTNGKDTLEAYREGATIKLQFDLMESRPLPLPDQTAVEITDRTPS